MQIGFPGYKTRQEAAKEMHVSTRTIDRWVKSGKVEYRMLHRSILIAEHSIDKMRAKRVAK